MRILIDTHVLIWTLNEPDRIVDRVRDILTNPDNTIHVSAVSAWEISIKMRLRKLVFDLGFLADFDSNITRFNWVPLQISAAHAVATSRLPSGHEDPFDRLLAAQARYEGLKLLSSDAAFSRLGIETLW